MGDHSKSAIAPLFALGVAAVSVAFLCGRYFQNILGEPGERSIVLDLAQNATDLNETLPEMVSEGVRLDKTSAGPGKAFNYFYTILDEDQARGLAAHPSRLQQIVSQLNQRVCMMMPNYVRNGVIVRYYLKNSIVADLPTVVVDPRDCNSNQSIRRE